MLVKAPSRRPLFQAFLDNSTFMDPDALLHQSKKALNVALPLSQEEVRPRIFAATDLKAELEAVGEEVGEVLHAAHHLPLQRVRAVPEGCVDHSSSHCAET